jgi:hypothetical protein
MLNWRPKRHILQVWCLEILLDLNQSATIHEGHLHSDLEGDGNEQNRLCVCGMGRKYNLNKIRN